MDVRWFGQSAFLLTEGDRSIAIDPFGDIAADTGRDMRFYRPVECSADLLLVTHEHADHNGVGQVAGVSQTIRSTAGRFDTDLGEVVAVASEHDRVAGTERGPNSIFVFSLGGFRIAHFGDFGQASLRPEQREAIGEVDVLMLPVGGGPTVGGAAAAAIAEEIRPSVLVPHHYRTPAIDFLEPPEEFLAALGWEVIRADGSAAPVEKHPEPRVLLLGAPG
ncbi:MAG TPA: MBL fold metallo-hydrolase [Gaiellaceae bacterium]|jgi:L-ascorbate metabolism protein UlaG (beta-lactamase superfamily)